MLRINISTYVFVKIITFWYFGNAYWDKLNKIPHGYIFFFTYEAQMMIIGVNMNSAKKCDC